VSAQAERRPTGPGTATLRTPRSDGAPAGRAPRGRADEKPLLEVDGISVRFGAVQALTRVSLEVRRGEVLAIIGPNGAGKTTLFGIATGTVAPDAGRVLLDGRDVTRLSPERRCRLGLARAFQIPQPFGGMTVFENLVVAAAFGQGRRERDVSLACVEILEQCGLADKANRLAGALTLLDRKRLELARALATGPRVLLLDEVAGGLVEHECATLVSLIKAVRATGVSIVWIEHVVHALLAVADRLMCLTYGRMLALGPPAEVLAAPEVRQTYLGVEPDPAGDAA
jgi:branched-chain amino acid transport system ATP-binding protein